MKSLCFAWVLTSLFGTVVLAQSNPVPPVNQPLLSKSPAPNSLSKPDQVAQGKIVESYGKLPLSFEANQGQTDAKVKFLSRGTGYTLFLTGDEALFSLRGSEAQPSASLVGDHLYPKPVTPTSMSVLRMKLVKANHAAKVTSADELPGKSNYFIGNDPKKWRTNVPNYAKVKYESVYPGIDLVYYGNQRQLEYDFVVAPGADPRRIQFDVRGAKKIRRDRQGDLVAQVKEGAVRWRQPVVYQVRQDGTRLLIKTHYVLISDHRIAFSVGTYEQGKPLIIDPALGYSTYLGGNGINGVSGIAVDGLGNVYVAGSTDSGDFPTTPGVFQAAYKGNGDAFITKFNPTGTALVYSTYLGGSLGDSGIGIAVDGSGNAYVTGNTFSTDFPITPGAFQTICGGYCSYGNAFVTKLDSTGSALAYSTYLGGSGGGGDIGNGVAVDASGNAYITGVTHSTDFPVTQGAFQTVCAGSLCYDAFVTDVSPTGSALVYSTFLGGSGDEFGSAIAVGSSGNVYVTGGTTSPNFPTTLGAFQTILEGGDDAFVTQLNASGSALAYSTFLGGSGGEAGHSIGLDSSGSAYVAGVTSSNDFPTTPGAFQTSCGGGNCDPDNDGFVTKLNPLGTALMYSTYLGGSAGDDVNGIAVDASGNAYVTGLTYSTDFPTTAGAFQTTCDGGSGCSNWGDAFLAELISSGSSLAYSSYLGGSMGADGSGVAVDVSGDIYATGGTVSTDFPITPGAFQTSCGGTCNWNSFIAKFIPGDQVWPLTLNFGNQIVGTTSNPQNTTFTNSETTAITVASIVINGTNKGDFVETNNCPPSLAPGASCMISVTFNPTAPYNRTASLAITDSAANSPQTALLSGIGVGALVVLSPPSLNFGNETVNIASGPQVSTLMNTGNGTLTITSIGVIGANSGDFPEKNNCGTSVPPGGSCQISVTFKPSGTGSESASVSIMDNGPGSPQSLPLSGIGVLPAVTFSPTSLTFPDQTVFTTSPAQKVTLTNTGLGIMKITAGGISGQFGGTTTCAKTLAPGASCTINVTFKPTTKGTLNGDISVTDNAPGSPQTVPLTGTGTYVQLSPTSVNFGTQPVNTTSLPKYITLTNKGSAPVNFTGTGISITGTNEGDFAEANNCGNSVASGASCRIKVTFTPSKQGQRTADVSISDDGGGSPQTVPLMGTGTP